MNRAILIGLVVTGAAAAAACGSSGSSTGSGVPISTETNQDPLPNPQDPPPDPQNPLPSTQNPPPNPQNPPASSEQPTASGSSTSAPAISCGDLCNGVDSSCAGLCQQLCAALDVLGSDCAACSRIGSICARTMRMTSFRLFPITRAGASCVMPPPAFCGSRATRSSRRLRETVAVRAASRRSYPGGATDGLRDAWRSPAMSAPSPGSRPTLALA